MRLAVVLVAIAAVLFPVHTGFAAGYESGEIVVVSVPVGDDLYVAGGKVLISEAVNGDAVAAGGNVIVNNRVGADLQAAGGSLIINAPVEDDVRAAGGDVVLSSTVGGDLVVFGGNVTIPAGVVVRGDAVIGAGNIHLGGDVHGDLKVHAGTLDLTGSIGGKAELYATERININGGIEGDAVFAGKQVSLGPETRFGNNVSYWSPAGEMDFGGAAIGGRISYDPELSKKIQQHSALPVQKRVKTGLAAAFGGFFILTLLSGIVVIILSTLLLKGPFRRAGEELHQSFWKSMGLGVLILILLPMAGLLCLATIIGIPIGLFFLAVFLFSLIFGRAIAAIAFAAWLERRRVGEWSTGRLILVSIGLYTAIKVVGIVPLFGWLAVLLVVWAGFGALVMGNWGEKPAV